MKSHLLQQELLIFITRTNIVMLAVFYGAEDVVIQHFVCFFLPAFSVLPLFPRWVGLTHFLPRHHLTYLSFWVIGSAPLKSGSILTLLPDCCRSSCDKPWIFQCLHNNKFLPASPLSCFYFLFLQSPDSCHSDQICFTFL